MIHKILEPIATALQEIEWIDNYQGLVRRFDKKTAQGIETHMIGCGSSYNDCFDENGTLKSIVPDDNYMCLVVAESNLIQTGSSFRATLPNTTTASITLKFWLNYKKMGLTACDSIDRAIAQVLSKLKGITLNQGDQQQYQVNINNIRPTDPNIFIEYSSWDDRWSLYPYDYFTLDLSVETEIRTQCLDFITLDNEIEC
jgi:hypothetical protein